MIIEGFHEKGIFTENYPFRLVYNTEDSYDYPLHWHNAIELLYVMENTCNADVSGIHYSLNEKDILFIAGGDIHTFNIRNAKGKRVFIQFDISRLGGFGDIHMLKSCFTRTRLISTIDSQLHKDLEEQILKLIEKYTTRDATFPFILNARIYDILAILYQKFLSKFNTESQQMSSSKTFGLERLNKALKYIEDNYQKDISLKEVSKVAGFSEYHFSRLFKNITETNFHDFVNEFRIRKAENLLATRDMSITQAALAAGFSSTSTFNRLFKELKGCAPSEYRKILLSMPYARY
jgi:AraC-like DNA-binding protein